MDCYFCIIILKWFKIDFLSYSTDVNIPFYVYFKIGLDKVIKYFELLNYDH